MVRTTVVLWIFIVQTLGDTICAPIDSTCALQDAGRSTAASGQRTTRSNQTEDMRVFPPALQKENGVCSVHPTGLSWGLV
eukprot:6488880-Amphidinium_carterae.1